jgi:hypothetical protein
VRQTVFLTLKGVRETVEFHLARVTGAHDSVPHMFAQLYEDAVRLLGELSSAVSFKMRTVVTSVNKLVRVAHIVLFVTLSAPIIAMTSDLYCLSAAYDSAGVRLVRPETSKVVISESHRGDVSGSVLHHAQLAMRGFPMGLPMLEHMEGIHARLGSVLIRYEHIVTELKFRLRAFLDEAAEELGSRVELRNVTSMALTELGITYDLIGL